MEMNPQENHEPPRKPLWEVVRSQNKNCVVKSHGKEDTFVYPMGTMLNLNMCM